MYHLQNNNTPQTKLSEKEVLTMEEIVREKPYPRVLEYILKHEGKNQKLAK
jgi:hypothetical protein